MNKINRNLFPSAFRSCQVRSVLISDAASPVDSPRVSWEEPMNILGANSDIGIRPLHTIGRCERVTSSMRHRQGGTRDRMGDTSRVRHHCRTSRKGGEKMKKEMRPDYVVIRTSERHR